MDNQSYRMMKEPEKGEVAMFILHLFKPDLFLVIAVVCLAIWFGVDWKVSSRRFNRTNEFGTQLFDTYTNLRITNAAEKSAMGAVWILKWVGFITLFCHVFMALFSH